MSSPQVEQEGGMDKPPAPLDGPTTAGLVHTMVCLLSTDLALGSDVPPTYRGWLATALSLHEIAVMYSKAANPLHEVPPLAPQSNVGTP